MVKIVAVIGFLLAIMMMPVGTRSLITLTTNKRSSWRTITTNGSNRNSRPNYYFTFACTATTTSLASKGGKSKKPRGFGTGGIPLMDEENDNKSDSITSNSTSAIVDAADTTTVMMNTGQRKLASLRAEQQSKKDDELRKVQELVSMEQYVREVDPNAAVIPERVANRMGQRMLPFVGIPLFGGMGAFVAFWYLATYKNLEYQPALVATTTIGLLVIGLLGITYSLMSASWDPDGPEGSALGFDEFKTNVANLKDGFARSKENALTRDRMSKMSYEELGKVVDDVSIRRDEGGELPAPTKKGTKFEDKLKDAGL